MEASNFRNCPGNQKSESTEKGQFGFISVQSFIFRDIRFSCLLYFRQSNQMNTEAWWHQYSYRVFQLTGPAQKVFKIPKKWKQRCLTRLFPKEFEISHHHLDFEAPGNEDEFLLNECLLWLSTRRGPYLIVCSFTWDKS